MAHVPVQVLVLGFEKTHHQPLESPSQLQQILENVIHGKLTEIHEKYSLLFNFVNYQPNWQAS